MPTRQPLKPVSVQATRNFFETKASESRSAAPIPPSAPALIAKGPLSNSEVRDQPPRTALQRQKDRETRATCSPAARKESDPKLPLPRPPPDAAKRSDLSQRTNPFVRQNAESTSPKILVNTSTYSPQAPATSFLTEEPTGLRRRSTNIFEEPAHSAKPPTFERRAVDRPSRSDGLLKAVRTAVEDSKVSDESSQRFAEEPVRRRATQNPVTAAEDDVFAASSNPKRPEKDRRVETDRHVRKASTRRQPPKDAFDQDGEIKRPKSGQNLHDASLREPTESSDSRATTRRSKRNESQSEPFETSESQRRSERESTLSATTDLRPSIHRYVRKVGERANVAQQLDDIAAKNLSHDGSSSNHSFSRRISAPASVPAADIGIERGYYDVEVPDHVDWRGAYGRRITKDFGFPGARIKPRRTYVSTKPLQDPGNWIKRACGHFSKLENNESREDGSRQRCRQCLTKRFPAQSSSAKHCSVRKRAATDSSTSSDSSSTRGKDGCGRPSRRRQHHSECIPTDKCGDTFARELGITIDSILEEHANTLQDVIINIKSSQPSLKQLRKVSQDLIERCQSSSASSMLCHTPCRCKFYGPCKDQHICRPVCQPIQQEASGYMPPCPYIPPRAAEKLNVGKPGQVEPNLNDSRSSLRESTKSVPDLINLVNSAADDLGVDLDKRPSLQDDERFVRAPVERTPQHSIVSHPSLPLETVEEKGPEEEHPSEDTWLQKTRRQLTELSEARSQLMDELDSIAEDLGVHLQERSFSEREIDPIQRALSKVSTGLSKKSSHLRNKSVDTIADEIPRMLDQEINQRRLSRVLTRIQTQSRRVSAVSQGLLDLETIPPEEIQEWLEVAQTELPAAIDSIATVLETLPALEARTPLEESRDEPVFEYQYEPQVPPDVEPEEEYEAKLEPEYDSEDYPETQRRQSRTYTEPILALQDRVADLERRLLGEPIPVASSEYSEGEEEIPEIERARTEAVGFEPPVESMALEESELEQPLVKRITTRRSTHTPSRKPTQATHIGRPESFTSRTSWDRKEGTFEPRYEEVIPEDVAQPVFEPVASQRKSLVASRQPTLLSERAYSFASARPKIEEEHELSPSSVKRQRTKEPNFAPSHWSTIPAALDDAFAQTSSPSELSLRPHQKITEPKVEPDAPSRRSTRPTSSLVRVSTMPEPMVELKETPSRVATERKVSLLRAATIPGEPEPEGEIIRQTTTRKSTIIPSRRSTTRSIHREPSLPLPTDVYNIGAVEEGIPLIDVEKSVPEVDEEIESRPSVMHKATSARYEELSPSPAEEVEFVPPVIRKATSVLQEEPTPNAEEDVEFTPSVRRKVTSVPQEEPAPQSEERDEFIPPVMRKATSTRQEGRRDSIRPPSYASSLQDAAVEDFAEGSPVSRKITRQLTRLTTERIEPAIDDGDFELPISRVRQTSAPSPDPKSVEEDFVEPSISPPISRKPTEKDIERAEVFDIPETTPPVFRSRTGSLLPLSKAVTEALASFSPASLTRSPSPVPEASRDEILEEDIAEAEPEFREPSPEPVMRKATTRRSIEYVASPEPILSRATTRRPTEKIPSPAPVGTRVATRQLTERLPSPEQGVRKVATRRRSERQPSPEPVLRKVTTRKPTERILSPEPTISRTITRKPTEYLSSLESDVEEEILRRPTEVAPTPAPFVGSSTTRKPTEVVLSPELEIESEISRAPMERIASPELVVQRGTARKPSEQLSSPTPEVGRAVYRQPTEKISPLETVTRRTITHQSTKRMASPGPEVRKAKTRKPTTTLQQTKRIVSPEPAVQRMTTQQPAERFPSPEPIIRKATTRQRTEPLEEISNPPYFPTLQSGESLAASSRKPTQLVIEEADEQRQEELSDPFAVSHMARALSRVESLPRTQTETVLRAETKLYDTPNAEIKIESEPEQAIEELPSDEPILERQRARSMIISQQATSRREFVQPQTIKLPMSASSSTPSLPSMHEEPTTSISKQDSAPGPLERMISPTISRQPTIAERRATFERSLRPASAQSTLEIERQLSLPPRKPTRWRTELEKPIDLDLEDATFPISRQPTRRRSEVEQLAILDRHATRQPTASDRAPARASTGISPQSTRRASEPVLQPDLIQHDVTKQPTIQEREPTTLEQRPSRKPRLMSRTTTGVPTEHVQEIEPLECQQIIELNHPPAPDPVHSFEIDESIMPTRRDRVLSQISRESTRVSTRLTIPADEGMKDWSSLTEPEEEPAIRQAMTRRSTLPSPNIPDAVQREATRRSSRRDREPSTVEERSPSSSPISTYGRVRTATDEPEVERASKEAGQEGSVGSSTVSEPLPIPSHRTTTRWPTELEREATTAQRQPSLPFQALVEEINVPKEPAQELTKRASTKTENQGKIAPEPELEQLVDSESSSIYSEPKSEPVIPVNVVTSRQTTQLQEPPSAVEYSSRKPSLTSRPSQWSTEVTTSESVAESEQSGIVEEDILEPEQKASTVSRKPTTASMPVTESPTISSRQSTIHSQVPSQGKFDDEAIPEPPSGGPSRTSRQLTSDIPPSLLVEEPLVSRLVSRQPTRTLRQATVRDDSPSISVLASRQPTIVSEKSTKRERSLTRDFTAVGRMAQQESETAAEPEPESEGEIAIQEVAVEEPVEPVVRKHTTVWEESQPVEFTIVGRMARTDSELPEESDVEGEAIEDELVEPVVRKRTTVRKERLPSELVNADRIAHTDFEFFEEREDAEKEAPYETLAEIPPTKRTTRGEFSRQSTRVPTRRELDDKPLEEPLINLTPPIPSRKPTAVQEPERQHTLPYEDPLARFSPERMPSVAEDDDVEPQLSSLSDRNRSQTPSFPSLRPTTTKTRSYSLVERDLKREPTFLSVQDEVNLIDSEPSRKPTIAVSRKATRVPTERVSLPEEEEAAPLSHRATTQLSRQPTRGPPTLPPDIGQRQAQTEPVSPSVHSSVLDEPLASLDVYNATPASPVEKVEDASADESLPQEQSSRKPTHTPTRRESIHEPRSFISGEDFSPKEKAVRVQDEPTAFFSPYPTPDAQARRATLIAPENQPTEARNLTEAAPEAPRRAETYQQVVDRQPALPAEEIPEEEPGRETRSPTADLSREPASLAPPEPRVAGEEAPNVLHKKRRLVGLPVSRIAKRSERPEQQRVTPMPQEKQRKPSSAQGIAAPPVNAVQPETKPVTPHSRPRDAVPPEEQHPPAPAYPVRDSPAWIKPDVYTPPPKPRANPLPKTKEKRGIFARSEKPKEETHQPEHSDPLPHVRQPEAYRERPRVEPFRSAAPGKA